MRGREEAARQGEEQSLGGGGSKVVIFIYFPIHCDSDADNNNLKLEGSGSQSAVQRERTEWQEQLTVGQQECGAAATWCRKPGRRDRTRSRPG